MHTFALCHIHDLLRRPTHYEPPGGSQYVASVPDTDPLPPVASQHCASVGLGSNELLCGGCWACPRNKPLNTSTHPSSPVSARRRLDATGGAGCHCEQRAQISVSHPQHCSPAHRTESTSRPLKTHGTGHRPYCTLLNRISGHPPLSRCTARFAPALFPPSLCASLVPSRALFPPLTLSSVVQSQAQSRMLRAQQIVNDAMAVMEKDCRPGVAANVTATIVEVRDVKSGMLEFAQSKMAELPSVPGHLPRIIAVMGSRELGPAQRLWLGSSGNTMLHNCEIPLIIVH